MVCAERWWRESIHKRNRHSECHITLSNDSGAPGCAKFHPTSDSLSEKGSDRKRVLPLSKGRTYNSSNEEHELASLCFTLWSNALPPTGTIFKPGK